MDTVTVTIRDGLKGVLLRLNDLQDRYPEVKGEKRDNVMVGGGGCRWFKRKILTWFNRRDGLVTYQATYIPMPPEQLHTLVYNVEGGAKLRVKDYERAIN